MTHTIQQVIDKLTAAELFIGNKHPAFAKISEAIAMLKDMQVVDVEVVPINSRIQRAAAALAALPPQRDELVEELVGALVSIEEYWNQDRNDQAMFDACWHAIGTAREALAKAAQAKGVA